MQQLCLVPGCPEVLLGLRGRKVQVCGPHRAAEAIDIDGDHFRYCGSCLTLHPVDEFSASSRVCREKESSYARGFLSRCQKNHWVSPGDQGPILGESASLNTMYASALRQAAGKAMAFFSASNQEADPGKHVWGSNTVAHLRGETRAAKVALPILYSAACYGLGPRKPETWASLAMAFSLLHLLVPYVHQHHYARPLREVRQSAAQPGLAVSAWFQFLDAREQAKYGEFAIGSGSCVAVSSVGQIIGVSLTAGVFAQPSAAVSRTGLLLFLALLAAVYFPARLHALAMGHRRRCQWMDTAMLILGHVMQALTVVYTRMTGGQHCGVPVAFISAGSELRVTALAIVYACATSVILAVLLNGTISTVVMVTALTSALRAPVIFLTAWCLNAETSREFSSVFPLVLLMARLTCSLLCVAVKVQHETARMMRYLGRIPVKQAEPLDSKAFYRGDEHLLLAVKMGDVTPAHLPSNLRRRLLSAMQVLPESFTGVIRPGCVLLGLEVRYRSWAEKQAALKALLSHSSWNETLLGGLESVIDMKIQGSLFRVSEGHLQCRLPGDEHPSVSLVEPLVAPSDCKTLTLGISSLGNNSFKVLLRCNGHYHQLQILQISAPSTVVVRLPDVVNDGMGWLEVMPDTEDGSLVMSEAFPVLFSSVQEVAAELNRVLPAHWSTDSHGLAGLFADLSGCLHEGAAAPPRLLQFVTKLGMIECFRHLATTRAVLSCAEQESQGLLGSAVLSGSLEMVDLVIHTLDKHGLPVNPCRRAPDAKGYTALHWAADAQHLGLVYKLLAEVPHPLKAWTSCTSRGSGKTPAELLAEAGREFAVNEAILEGRFVPDGGATASHPGSQEELSCPSVAPAAMPEDAAAAVRGSGVAVAIGQHRVATHLSLLALYTAMLAQLGWQDPLAWCTVALTCVTMQLLVPYIYCELYVNGLHEVRVAAAEKGLAMSPTFRLLPVGFQKFYEEFAARRASARIFGSMLCTALPIILFSLPAGRLFEEWGMWRYTPGLLGCGVLLPLLGFTIRTGRVAWWQWVEPAVGLYCLWTINLPRSYGIFVIGDPDSCVVPSTMVASARAGNHLLLLLQPVALCLLLAATFAMVPKAPGAPVHLASEIGIIAFAGMVVAPVTQICVAHLSGAHNVENLRNVLRVVICAMWRLLLLGFRLRAERQNLCAFLRCSDTLKILGQLGLGPAD